MKFKEGEEIDTSDIPGEIISKLGQSFAFEDIVSVETIGLDDIPRTTSGKTQKHILRAKAAEYFKNQQVSNDDGDEVDAVVLIDLWSKHLGIKPADLNPQKNVLEYADSLVLSRFSAVLRKKTGYSLSLHELMDNPTIEAQAAILSPRSTNKGQNDYSKILSKRDGPPTCDEMIHGSGDDATYTRTKKLSEEVLSPLGLTWDDVEDVIPMHADLKRFLLKRRTQSNNHRHTWICKGKTTGEVEEALKKSLAHHSILRSMSIEYDSETSLHLTIRPSQQFFEHSFKHMPDVKTTEDLWKQCYNDPKLDWAANPGPMFQLS